MRLSQQGAYSFRSNITFNNTHPGRPGGGVVLKIEEKTWDFFTRSTYNGISPVKSSRVLRSSPLFSKKDPFFDLFFLVFSPSILSSVHEINRTQHSTHLNVRNAKKEETGRRDASTANAGNAGSASSMSNAN